MAEEKDTQKKSWFWNFIDNIQGDKVILIIIAMLILFSIVTIFSSTSMLADSRTSRLDIFKEQMVAVAVGTGLIAICYFIPRIWIFRALSQLGFLVSITFLALLHTPLGVEANGAVRAVQLGPIQVHAYEVTKVAMVLYLAWAIHAYKNDSFKIANWLSSRFPRMAFLAKPGWKRMIYIFLPVLAVCVGILFGSFSSTMFIGGIMFITILIGGIKFKDIIPPAIACIAVACLCAGIYLVSDGKVFGRFGTAISRMTMDERHRDIKELRPGSEEFQKALDAIKQPASAKIAIHDGGLFGKGPGNSTQKYTVPLMFSDYMFSFIIEEYGLAGGIVVIMLYVSLLARASLIVRACDNEFAKTAVAGLAVLISGQALMHMFINADLGPLTGQTLPMISHGKSSFFVFSIAFGVLLSISKMAKAKIKKEEEESEPLVEGLGIQDDNVQDTLSELDDFESGKGLPS